MTIANRRCFVKAAIAVTCLCASPTRLLAQRTSRGCSLSLVDTTKSPSYQSTGIGVVGRELSFTTGDASRDRALGLALVRMSQLFEERPGFGFIDDSDGPNAFAHSDHTVPGTWGTILMGRTLFQDLLRRFDDGGIAILAVIAHEFSHIAQYRRRVFDTLVGGSGRSVRAELHADFMTGYYLGLRKADNPSLSIRTAGVALYQIGDYAFNNKDHHGTPAQRVAAAEEGFKLANNKRSFVNAFNEGVNWILATHKD